MRGCPYGGYFSTQSSTLPAAMKTGKLQILPNAMARELITDAELKTLLVDQLELAALPAAIASAAPIAIPTPSSVAASRSTMPTMLLRVAPMAMRTPISWMRWPVR